MFDGKYLEWNHKKIKAIIDKYGHTFFHGKKILDLGAGHGDVGAAFYRLGANVTCVDARNEHLTVAAKKYPGINTQQVDLDVKWPFQQCDVILDLDLINHLKDYKKHLSQICQSANFIVLEAAVCDSDDPNMLKLGNENKSVYDWSFNGVSSYATAAGIEQTLRDLGASFIRLDNKKLNTNQFTYDWVVKNTNECKPNNRRLWFITKENVNVISPAPPSIELSQRPISFKLDHKLAESLNTQAIAPSPAPNPTPHPMVDLVPGGKINFRAMESIAPLIFVPPPPGSKKVKIYIVTYNSEHFLNQNLKSLFESDVTAHDFEVNIINNHSNFKMNEIYADKVKVIHNETRPDFSTGHLSRNWNQAIINGFKNLNNPDTEILVTCQVDTVFEKNWFSKLLKYHKHYSFIQDGMGDNMCSYRAEAIKKIGLWDERFCNIGFQEADFFMRALMYNKERSSINDYGHGRILNPINDPIVHHPPHAKEQIDAHARSAQYHTISLSVFKKKYGTGYAMSEGWKPQLISNPPKVTLIENYVYYPYFEKDVENLIGKNYVWTDKRKYFD